MIPFKMNVLNYNNGVYSVEYVPDHESCTPVKLDIKLDSIALSNPNEVLSRLKSSSPQHYWIQEVQELNVDTHDVLKTLVNTTHVVRDLEHREIVNPVTAFPPIFRRQVTTPRIEDIEHVEVPVQALPQQQEETSAPASGVSSPEQIANRNEQNVIRMKILIQQVLQEMAEGTV